jgi:hypothetical protein
MKTHYENFGLPRHGTYTYNKTHNIVPRIPTVKTHHEEHLSKIEQIKFTFSKYKNFDLSIDLEKLKQIAYKDMTKIMEEIYAKVYIQVMEKLNDDADQTKEEETINLYQFTKDFLLARFEDKPD